MSIFELFSKRQKKLRGDVPEVYTYDQIPDPLRVQIVHIWHDAIGTPTQARHEDGPLGAYRSIVDLLCREYGVFRLADCHWQGSRDYYAELVKFFLAENDTEKALDVVELSALLIDGGTRDWSYLHRQSASEIADEAIEELNGRFREHGLGYQYESGKLIRVDSELLHTEAVKPALVLLRATDFEGAEVEFRTAHEHYRHGRTKEALNESLKAFESTMKVICDKHNWPYDKNAPAKTLLQTLFDRGIVPPFWQQHFTSLRLTLEAGVPSARNKLGGHGQGSQIIEVPEHLVAYVLHMTASAILFLAQAERALP